MLFLFACLLAREGGVDISSVFFFLSGKIQLLKKGNSGLKQRFKLPYSRRIFLSLTEDRQDEVYYQNRYYTLLLAKRPRKAQFHAPLPAYHSLICKDQLADKRTTCCTSVTNATRLWVEMHKVI